AGFLLDEANKNISAIIFSSTATLSKFNRIGRQAGMGNGNSLLVRTMTIYNHNENADKPDVVNYYVDENANETWSEGVMIYHNPHALYP
ncbi:hypothetical protein N7272_14830, partial [Enterococcus faecalis]|nr:hypothetical protein [Enterococcus faecalis]